MCDNENHYIDIIKHSSENKNVEFLERCTEMAINMAAKGNLSDAIKLVSNIFPLLNAPWLESCVMQLLLKASGTSECDIYDLFRNGYQSVLGNGYKIIRVKNDPRHIPDFWVEIYSERIPVECKAHRFDKKALDQLLRYMRFYKCTRGIAVGENFSCEIPDTITPISIDQLRRCTEQK